MNPTELKDLIGRCVNALSDDRTQQGLYPVQFFFGTASDIFLNNTREDSVDRLEDAGVIHMEFVRFAAIEVSEETNSQAYNVRMIFSKGHNADSETGENLTLITDMYNLKQDLLKVMNGHTVSNLSSADQRTINTWSVSETQWSPFDYAPNLTAGITCTLIINTKYCRQ